MDGPGGRETKTRWVWINTYYHLLHQLFWGKEDPLASYFGLYLQCFDGFHLYLGLGQNCWSQKWPYIWVHKYPGKCRINWPIAISDSLGNGPFSYTNHSELDELDWWRMMDDGRWSTATARQHNSAWVAKCWAHSDVRLLRALRGWRWYRFFSILGQVGTKFWELNGFEQ